uniref:F-box domain-containing protein n=1 Tax=Oryza rufipogon TaxID=4529 RepID=A0A0E0PY67_ORYRU
MSFTPPLLHPPKPSPLPIRHIAAAAEAAMESMETNALQVLGLDDNMRMVTKNVYSSLPDPPVSLHAPLAFAAAAWPPRDGVDRISALPVDILRDILSRLPARDAARTSALSTRWRRLWRSAPLVLADAHLKHTGRAPGPDELDRTGGLLLRAMDGMRDVARMVSSALAAHPGPFRSVHITCTPMDAHRSELALWLQLLAARGVQELVFVNRASKFDTDVPFPATLFRCSSLTRLYIGFLRFPAVATVPRAASFPHLRELGLCSLIMGQRELAFLLDRCPVLENFEIVCHRELLRLRVASHSLRCVEVCMSIVEEITVEHAARLERLMFWETCGTGGVIDNVGGIIDMRTRVKIGHAPNLRVLGFLVPVMHELSIGNTDIRAGTKPTRRTMVPSVQMLGIQLKLFDNNQVRMLPSFLRCFPNVETLYIQSETTLSGNTTGKLNPKLLQETSPIECLQKHIKKVIMREFRMQRSELDFLKFIAGRGQVLEKVVVVLTHTCSSSADRLRASLSTFMASTRLANEDCKLIVYESPFPIDATAWCFQGAFNMSKDPFDIFT